MNFNDYTIKAQEAVQQAVNLAQSHGQQAIEPVHLLQGVMKVGEQVTRLPWCSTNRLNRCPAYREVSPT